MSEKARFHNMTKPIKFRTFKLIFQSVGLTYEVGNKRISYLIDYLLYKLNILKRYNYKDNSYRDNTEVVLSKSDLFAYRCIESEYFKGLLVPRFIDEVHIDKDYFYKVRKDNSKKITHTVSDCYEVRTFMYLHLEDIQVNLNDTWYSLNNLPTLYVELLSPEDSTQSKFKTVKYDIDVLRNLESRVLLGISDYIETECKYEVKYFYDEECKNFKDKLDSMTLKDIIVEEK